jgi:predicted transcriptional regulator
MSEPNPRITPEWPTTVTISTKRQRVYPRKFDWDVAKRMHAAGGSLRSIAKALGVSPAAIDRVVNPQRFERMRESLERRQAIGSGTCVDCGAPISRNYTRVVERCMECAAVDAAHKKVKTARETTLQCWHCREWKPDAEFSPVSSNIGRRHRSGKCHRCDMLWKRERRASARVVR